MVRRTGIAPLASGTWESVLDAYTVSANTWVSATARAWRTQPATLVPHVDSTTIWNDVPDDAAGMELALPARIAWLAARMDSWCHLDHELDPSSGGGSWAARMWAPASTPEHFVTAEIQEGMTAFEWRPDPDHYRQRLKGPVVLLGVRQDNVSTSADFDWSLLHRLFAKHILDSDGRPQPGVKWQTTPAGPRDPIDKANWQSTVAAGAPTWLGKGLGMSVAQSVHSCLFGARLTIAPGRTLGEIDTEIARLGPLIVRMAMPQVSAPKASGPRQPPTQRLAI